MRKNRGLKALAAVVCVLSAAAAFWSGLVSLVYWEEMWTEADYYASPDFQSSCSVMRERIQEAVRLERLEAEGRLTYSQTERLGALRASLDPASTNYRYELRLDQTGELVGSNLGGGLLEDVAEGIQMGVFVLSDGTQLHEQDERYWLEQPEQEEDGEVSVPQVLRVWTGEEYVELRADGESVGYNAYGWYNSGGSWEGYDTDRDGRVSRVQYVLRCGLLRELDREDAFRAGYENYAAWHGRLPAIGGAAAVSLGLFLFTLVYLCRTAGRREGEDGIHLGALERVPLDVCALAVFLLAMLGISLGDAIAYGLNMQVRAYRVVGLLAVSALVAAALLALALTTAVRLKAHVFWRTTLIWRLCAWSWRTLVRAVRAAERGVRELFHGLSMNLRLASVFAAYLLANGILAAGFFRSYSAGFYLVGLVALNGGALLMGLRWIAQWRAIREGTGRIVGGDPTVQMDTRGMYGDLREHAEQLNDLGTAINHAVDERLKSEHFKAELITNVSHDLKTPLTSIINYVDLLKKLDIADPTAREYLEVLDRKGQRLKKLTEDLVEASKASTGNVTVNAARMDLVEFTQQAAAEYEDRLRQHHLTLITKMADHPVYISADGRHMWRILDNLLSNCAKYALEGTRVYLEVVEWDGKASICLKNISREPLEADPDTLTERFVRGDESRTTEGSGLGLSIARSLTQVQGGTLRISTDGDLFKAGVYFPVLLALESAPPA